MKIKDSKYVKINRVKPLYLIFIEVNRYFEDVNVNEYSALVPTNEGKEIVTIENIMKNV